MRRFGTSALSVRTRHTHALRVGVRVRGWIARSRCSGVLPVRARVRVGLPSPVRHAVQYHEAPPLALRRRRGHAAARAVVRRLRLGGRGLHRARRTCSLVPGRSATGQAACLTEKVLTRSRPAPDPCGRALCWRG
eukprot:scaffold29864_cov63-Phaeocystis_antarctica.AAC.3